MTIRIFGNYLAKKTYYEEDRIVRRSWAAMSANHKSREDFNMWTKKISPALIAVQLTATRELRSSVFDFFGLVAQKCPTYTGLRPAAAAGEVDF